MRECYVIMSNDTPLAVATQSGNWATPEIYAKELVKKYRKAAGEPLEDHESFKTYWIHAVKVVQDPSSDY